MRKRFAKQAALVLLSAGMMFGTAMPVLAVSDNSVSNNTTPEAPAKADAPTNLSATQKDEKTILLSWTPVSGVDGYCIGSKTNDNDFTDLWKLPGGDVSSMDVLATFTQNHMDLNNGRALNIASTYSFKIMAYKTIDGKDYYGNESATVTIKLNRRNDTNDEWILASTPVDYNTLDLSWRPAGGVTGYKVLMSTSKDGQYQVLTTTDRPSARIEKDLSGKELSLDKTYYFKVQAYINDNGKEFTSTESPAIEAKTALAEPEYKKLYTDKNNHVIIKWKKVAGASGYEVYRSKKEKKTGSVIAGGKKKTKLNKVTKLKKLTYTDKSTAVAVEYWYRIRAYRTINGKRYYSEFNSWPWATSTVLSVPKFDKENCGCAKANTISLKWNKIDKAKGYFIERSDNETKGFKTIATIDGGNNTATEIQQDNGTKYYYRIRAFSNKKKKKTWSSYVDPIRLTSNYYTYPAETFSERCMRIFGKESYTAYLNQSLADSQMADVSYTLWSTDPEKKTAGLSVKTAKSFKVNKRLQPTIQQIVKEIESYQIQPGVTLKITGASGYNFGSAFQEDRDGVSVTIKVDDTTPGTAQYNALAGIMAKYGFNRISNSSQAYDPFRFVYVGIH